MSVTSVEFHFGPVDSPNGWKEHDRMPVGLGNPLHILLLLVVVLLVFGAKRLPEMGRSLGQGMREFKGGILGHDTAEVPSRSGSSRPELAEHSSGPELAEHSSGPELAEHSPSPQIAEQMAKGEGQ